MEHRFFADHLADSQFRNRLLITLCAVFAVCLVLLACYATYQGSNARAIIVPTHLAGKVELKGETGSPDYVRIMTLHMTGLLYTYTPHNVADRYKEFMAFIPPERIEDVKSSLQRRVDQIAKLKISESFMLKEFHLLPNNVALIAGSTIRWSAGQELTTEAVHIKYNYSMLNGGFRVESVTLLSQIEYNGILRDPALTGSKSKPKPAKAP